MTQDKTLKPCPFCNSKVKWETESNGIGLRAWIKCPQCRQAQICSDWYNGDLGTTEASWNTRATPTHPEGMRSAEEESYYVDRVTMECIKITGEQFCNEQNWPDVIATIMDAMDRCKPQDKKGDAAQCKRSAEDGWLPIDDYAKSGKPVYVKGGTYNSDREQYHGMKCDEPVLVRYKVQSNPDVDPPWVSVDNNSLAIKYPTHYWPCNPPSSQEGAG